MDTQKPDLQGTKWLTDLKNYVLEVKFSVSCGITIVRLHIRAIVT
jgi:hypothetical protein